MSRNSRKAAGRIEPRHPDDVEPPAGRDVPDARGGREYQGTGILNRQGRFGSSQAPVEIARIIGAWPKEPQASASRLFAQYGQPDEYSESQLIWYNTKDGWKRTVLSREEVPHNFPSHHTDFLEQSIDYKLPLDKFSALAEFDGSVIAERTKGEISARCGGTSMNFVAINLAHDIVTGKRNVQEARDEYTRLYLAYQRGEHSPYMLGFQFPLPKGDTGDLDAPTV